MISNLTKYFNKSYFPIYKSRFNDFKFFSQKVIFIPMLNFLTSPLSTVIMVLLQLSLGAVLGADISIKISKSDVFNNLDMNTIAVIWDLLNPFTKRLFYFVVFVSLLKSIFEVVLKYLEKSHEEKILIDSRSLPEKSAINFYYANTIPKLNVISEEFRGNKSVEEIQEGILDLLDLVKDFAAHWDSQSPERFSCNLMYYFPISNIITKQINEGWEVLNVFFNAPNSDSAAKQILGVFAVIASANSSRNFYLDKSQSHEGTRLLLPVSDRDNKNHSRQYFPGAPEVFNLKNYQYLPDILLNISKWLNYDQDEYFTPTQKSGVYKYYLNDKSNRSLLSLPCVVPFNITLDTQSGKTESLFNENQIVAVLNIYSMDKNMLSGAPDVFYQFCKPILTEIAKLCCSYEIRKKI